MHSNLFSLSRILRLLNLASSNCYLTVQTSEPYETFLCLARQVKYRTLVTHLLLGLGSRKHDKTQNTLLLDERCKSGPFKNEVPMNKSSFKKSLKIHLQLKSQHNNSHIFETNHLDFCTAVHFTKINRRNPEFNYHQL